jgi:hypothetical protein
MLAYLDALIAALAARNTIETDRLLAHPLARILSPEALADATAERRAAVTDAPAGTPLHLLQLRYRTAQLLADSTAAPLADRVATVAADAPEADSSERKRQPAGAPAWSERRSTARTQMELPLSA